MARSRYATSGGDVAVSVNATTGALSMPTSTPAPFPVYDAFVGGSQVTDLTNAAGDAITAAPAPTASNPQATFFGPDGYTGYLYVQDAAGRRWRIEPDTPPTAGASTSVNGIAPVSGNVTLDQDDIPDGTTKVGMTPAERTALAALVAGGGGEVTIEAINAALADAGLTLQGQFLNALGADDAATRALFASILGFVASPSIGKLIYNRDYTAATAATVTRPNGTDTTKTIVRWRATDGTTTLPAAYIAGNDEQRIVRQP